MLCLLHDVVSKSLFTFSLQLWFKMANVCDSEAHFTSRAREYGVSQALLNALHLQGVRTMAHLAFSIVRPGAEFNEAAFDQWTRDVNQGVPLSMGELAALRRLHFESEVVITASLKSAVETPDQASPRPIPFAERNIRLEELRRRLGGISIKGANEPSHALLDECCQQFELRTLRYVDPTKCTSRETEVTHSKTSKKLKLDSSSLQVTETKTIPDESVSTTYNLSLCLLRRGLAYDFSGLIAFDAHQRYCDRLLRHLSIEPPPGFQATTLAQVLRADKEAFSFLSQNCDDIRPPGTVRPLDKLLEDALRDCQTTFHLLPLPKEHFASNVRYKAEQSERQHSSGAAWHGASSKPKGKGKGGGKSGKGFGSNAAPRGFVGCVGRDAKNRPLCFDWQVGKCSSAPAGGACPKGRHNCFKGGCFKPHRFCDARPDEMPKQPTQAAE